MNKVCAQCGSAFDGHCNAQFCGAECRQKRRLVGNKIWGATYRAKNRKPRPEPEPIAPFPDEIDRDEFGNWLSGFCDGESTFLLRVTFMKDRLDPRINQSAHFRITLRDDDAEILKSIRSYWGCGTIYYSDNIRSKTKANPIAAYGIQAVSDLARIVVPHFEQFPLRSKKRNDFMIWKEGIELMAQVQTRPPVGRMVLGGIMPRWSDEERDRFRSLCELLSHQREYTSLRSS